jgi:hypothetical protein
MTMSMDKHKLKPKYKHKPKPKLKPKHKTKPKLKGLDRVTEKSIFKKLFKFFLND